ncbi:hypothetical protein NDU88_004099 [Pleurodeles waltl]|uniref:Uncharacterized protein n=1 Tax=Pleurodeles waltl TaxID=8319 RepID=A0AAV7L0X5_PLEWA|nr:hypothetical protein NDU88_004099 [Pleurodeles waltl]
MAAPQTLPAAESSPVPSCPTPESTMEHIPREVKAVSGRQEGMDNKISDLAAKTNSIHTDIGSFQGVERRLAAVEHRLNTLSDRDQECLYLRDTITDLEYQSRRDNVCFFSFPEFAEGRGGIKGFVKGLLPSLIGLTFPPIGAPAGTLPGPWAPARPHPIITCFLCHEHAWQLLVAARTQWTV